MAEESLRTKQQKNKKRRWLKVVGILAFCTLFLQASLYYGGDWLLRELIKRQVEDVSEGKYAVDFDRIYFSLLQRGLFVKGFSLNPTDPAIFDEQKIPYYQIDIDQLDLLGLSYSRSSGHLSVGSLRLTSPGCSPGKTPARKIPPTPVPYRCWKKKYNGRLERVCR